MSLPKNHETYGLPSKEIFFQGKLVVVTGGASGIGRALAERLSKLNANVTVIDIAPAEDLDEKISYIQADVSTLDVKVPVEIIDLLVIAAGVTSYTNEPTQQEKDVMEAVNVRGVVNTLRVFESRLTPRAQVVYIGSDRPPKDFYADTKKRGAELVKALAKSHPDLDVRIILLGPARTPLFEKGKSAEVIQRIAQNVGLYEPAEFAEELIEKLIEPSQQESTALETVMYKKIR